MATMTAGAALMEILHREGVEYVFGVPGATEVVFLGALEKRPEMRYVLCLHEVIAVGAAEGYARASGKVGVVNLHTGCGLASSMGLLFNACRGGVPLVVTAGKTDSHILLKDPHLAGELVRMAQPLTKWAAEALYPEDVPMLMQRAIKMAQQPPAGPVFVSLPQDLLQQDLDFSYRPGTPVLKELRPDTDAIRHAAALIETARRPAIIVENGVAKNGAVSAVVALAEQLGARVYQQWMSDVNFPNQHPLYAGELRTSDARTAQTLAPCDVIVVIGCQLFGQALHVPEPLIAPGTKVIQIDDDPWEIAKNFPVDVGIQANIKIAVGELTAALDAAMPEAARADAAKRSDEIARETAAEKTALLEKTGAERRADAITDGELILALRDNLKPGTLVVDDCWTTSVLLRRVLDLSEPGGFQRSRLGGSIGWGMPGALGVQLAAPERPVVAVCGDGSAAWSMQSLWTAARYKLPVTYAIVNNAAYRTVKHSWANRLGGSPAERHEVLELDSPVIDFSGLAAAMGVTGTKVSRPQELSACLKAALDAGRPNLIEVMMA